MPIPHPPSPRPHTPCPPPPPCLPLKSTAPSDQIGTYCSLSQLLESGFYHADPHPGNLLRTTEGKLAYLDFGMMGQMPQVTREALIRAAVHLVNREFDALAKDFVTLG